MKNRQIDYINDYYDTSNWLYRLILYSPASLGLHFGFWTKNTKNRHQAIINESLEIIKQAKILKNDRVLDAGCGVGGTAIMIAKRTGAQVTGININAAQIRLAKRNAKRNGVEKLVKFRQLDYTKTDFDDNSFDVVYGIESICYSAPKSDFINEAYRILKHGGRLVIEDGYLTKLALTLAEKKIIDDFNWAFALDEFTSLESMNRHIVEAKFLPPKVIDNTQAVWPTARYLYNLGLLLWPVAVIGKWLPIAKLKAVYRNDIAVINSFKIIRDGLGGHYTHVAIKP